MRTLAVLASGQGTNFEALAHAAADGRLAGRIAVLVSDRPDAPALARARRLGIEALALDAGRFRTRLADEQPWVEALTSRGVDTVLLAGFMRRLHHPFLSAFPDRILNIHPSLLPAFPGLDTHARALAAGVRFAGCTVHLVRPETDSGPILAQAVVPVAPDDTPERLAARVLAVEHRLYPLALRWLAEGRVRVIDERAVIAGVSVQPLVGINPLEAGDAAVAVAPKLG
jgi:phosphoribosylglycinamide formyltransferase 1